MQNSMQTVLVFMLTTAFLTHANEEQSAVTPVQKVIQLMNGMLEKGKAEKQAEQVQFAAYKQWCDDTNRQKTAAIAEANEMIEVLKADIQKYAADAELLSKQIAKHEEDITVWTGDQNAATKVRAIEKGDYDAAHADYSESIDALGRAIAVLKKQASDKKQAAFTQLSELRTNNLIPDDAKRTIDAFLAQDPQSGMDYVAPEANAYEFQSSGIVDMLADLLRKFTDERTTLEKEETSSRQNFEMLMSDMDSQIANAQAGLEKDREDKAKALKAKASAEGDLADTIVVRDEDQKFLDDTMATCTQKATDFEARQQLRAEEIEAIEKAIEIISSSAVSGAADKHLPGLIQQKATSLAQFRSSNSLSPAQFQVAIYLQDKARQFNSRVLGLIAERVEKDPFKKVKKMIKDLIDKLMVEANEEAAHKGWCDTELATNEKTRKKKTDEVETLQSEIEELTASIAKLTEEITNLSQAVADLDAAVAKATSIREAEKAKNEETIKDAQEAQTAVAQALTVLKEFYAKAGKATAFVQQPEIFDKPYKGMGGMAGGVVGMLEVIESDFARVQAETTAAEAAAVKEYEQFMHDSTVDKADMQRDIEHKKVKKENESAAVVEQKVDLEGTQKELDAALRYYDKLKPSCVDSGVSYEERVKQREQEIQSLQEALKILNGESI